MIIRIVTTVRQRIIDAEPRPAVDDLGLGEVDERGVDLERIQGSRFRVRRRLSF